MSSLRNKSGVLANGQNILALAAALTSMSMLGTAYGAGRGGVVVNQVTHGSATFNQAGSILTIRAGDRTIINYKRFDVFNGETVRFIQPSASARVLNRITATTPSKIDGTITANGVVYFVNPSGIVFGKNSVLNVGQLFAASGNMSDANYLANVNRFSATGTVANEGMITAQGGVSLVGRQVINSGTIAAEGGVVTMVSGDDVMVGTRDGHILVKVGTTDGGPATASKGGVTNTGSVKGIEVSMAAGDMYSMAIGGLTSGKSVNVTGGGNVAVTGKIDASDKSAGGKGGSVVVTGKNVSLTGATIDASGDAGGGEVLVGGDFHGQGVVPTAQTTTVDNGTTITASAISSGDGGKVVVWSDKATSYNGAIAAKGGATGGDGGTVEVSGKLTLAFNGQVDTTAPMGNKGSLLLDPDSIEIVTAGPDIAGDGSNNDITAAGDLDDAVNDFPGAASKITAGAVVTLLDSTDLSLAATNTITVNSAVDASGNTNSHALTLTAGADVTVNQPITLKDATLTLTGTTGTVGIHAGLDTGAGSILVTAGKNIVVDSVAVVQTTSGGVTLNANQQGTPATGNIEGILIAGATVTSGSGPILIQGKGGDTGVGNFGVFINNGGIVSSTGTGAGASTITINGSSQGGTDFNAGVFLSDTGTKVTSKDGAIQITGTGGAGTSNNNFGVGIQSAGSVSSTGNATVTIEGTGGGTGGGAANIGVAIYGDANSMVTSKDGDIQITGTGGLGTGNHGIDIGSTGGAVTSTGNANIKLIADDTNLATTTAIVNAGSQTVTFAPETAGTTISLGGGGTGLGLSDGELAQVTAGLVVATTSGNITVDGAVTTHAGYSVLSLVSGGSVTGTSGLAVTDLSISAGTGVGTSGSHFATTASAMEVETNTGGIFVTNTGALAVGFAGSPLGVGMQVNTSGDIGLTASGTITIGIGAETVTTPAGNVTVSATGVNSDVTIPGAGNNAIFGQVVTVRAGRDILAGDTAAGVGSIHGTGATSLQAGQNIVVSNNSFILGTSLGLTAGGNVTLQDGSSSQATSTNLSVVTGTAGMLTISGTADLEANGAITINADNLLVTSAATSVAGGVLTLAPVTSGQLVDLGGADGASTLGITSAELGKFTGSVVRVGSATAGTLTVSAAVGTGAVPLHLISGAGVSGTAAISATSLAVEAGTNISLSGTNAAGTLAAASSGGGAITFANGGALTIGVVDGVTGVATVNNDVTISANGNLSVDQAVSGGTGAVSLSAAGTITGVGVITGSTLALQAGGQVDLQSSNQVGTVAANLSGAGAFGFNNGLALTIGVASGVTGITTSASNAAVTAGGVLTVANAVGVGAGELDLTATAAITGAGVITAGMLGVNAGGAVNLTGAVGTFAASGTSVTFADSASLMTVGTAGGIVGVVTSGNGPIVLTADDMDFSDAVNSGAGGTVTLQNLTSGQAITLGAAGAGTLSLSTADLSKVTATKLIIGRNDGSASGTVSVNGAITSPATTLSIKSGAGVSGASAVTATNLAVQAGGVGSVSLTSASNAVTNVAISSANDVTFRDGSAVTVASSIDGISGVKSTGSGKTVAVTSAGNITLTDSVAAPSGTVLLISTGASIIENGGTATASTLGLKAVGSIGTTGTPMLTNVTTLAAQTTGGAGAGIFVSNTGALAIGEVSTSNLFGVQAGNGDVGVTAGGTIAVNLAGSSTDDVVFAQGNVTLKATVGDIVTGNWDGATNDGKVEGLGTVLLDAAHDVLIGDTGSLTGGSVVSGTDLTLTAGNNIVVDYGSVVESAGGSIVMGAGNAGRIDLLKTTGAAGLVKVLSGSGTISMTAGAVNEQIGSAIQTAGGGVTVTTNDLTLGDGINVGTGTATIQPLGAGLGINLGTYVGGGGMLGISAADLGRISATKLVVGSGAAGNILVSVPVHFSTVGTLRLTTAGSVTDGGAGTIQVNKLAIDAKTGVTMNVASVPGQANSVNTFAVTGLTSGAVTFRNTGTTLTIGTADAGVSGVTSVGGVAVVNDGNVVTSSDVTGGGLVTFTLTGAGSKLTIGGGTTVSTTAGGVALTADKMDIQGAVTAAGQTVALAPETAGLGVDLGSATDVSGTKLELSQAELARITAGTLKVSGFTGGIAVTQNISGAGHWGELDLSATGAVSGTNTVTVTSLDAAGTSVSLTGSNTVGTLAGAASAGNFAFKDGSTLTIGTLVHTGVSATGTISLTSDDMVLNSQVNSGGIVTIQPVTSGGSVTIGGGLSGLGLSDADLAQITASVLRVVTTGTVDFDGNVTTHGGYSVMHVSGSDVTQSAGAIAVNSLAISATGSVTLNHLNAIGTIAGTGSSFTVSNTLGMTVGGAIDGVTGITTSGQITLFTQGLLTLAQDVVSTDPAEVDLSGGTGINQTGGKVAGDMLQAVATTGNIVLGSATNNFNTVALQANAGGATYTDANSVVIDQVGTSIGINTHGVTVVTATTGDLDFSGQVFTNGFALTGNATAGNISVGTNLLDTRDQSAGGSGGTIDLTASGTVTASSQLLTLGSDNGAGNGGNGGSIHISGSGVSLQSVLASGGNSTASGGNAGSVTVTATSGTITLNSDLNANGGMGVAAGSGGVVQFNGPVVLGDSIAVSGGSTGFSSTVMPTTDGGQALHVFAGPATFNGAVGTNVLRLSSLTVDEASTINGGAVFTTGQQNYVGAMTFNGDTTLTGLSMVFSSTIGVGSNNGGGLHLVATNNVDVTGAIGTTGSRLSFLTIDHSATLNGGSVFTVGNQSYGVGGVLVGASTTFTGNSITFNDDVTPSADAVYSLAVVNAGTVTFDGRVGFSPGHRFTQVTTGVGAVIVNGGHVETTGLQTYGAGVTVGADTTFNTSSDVVTFSSTLDGGFHVVVGGDAVLGGAVGGVTPLAGLHVTGGTAINGGLVSSTSGQQYDGAVTIGANAQLTSSSLITMGSTLDSASSTARTLTINSTGVSVGGAIGGVHPLSTFSVTTTGGNQTYGGAITLGGDGTFTASNVFFNSTIDGGFALQVNGSTTMSGQVGGVTPLTTVNVTGGAEIDGGLVATSGGQTFGGAVTIGATTLLTAGGAITLQSRLDSVGATPEDLTVNSNGFSVAGAIGSNHPLGVFLVNSGSGSQVYSNAIILGGDATYTGPVTFGGTIDGAHALEVDGAATFEAPVGGSIALTSVYVTGQSDLNGGLIHTTNFQSYLGDSTLTANAHLVLDADTLTFGGNLNSDGSGPWSLLASAPGGFSVSGAVGTTNVLSTIDITTSAGNQTFTGAVMLGGNATLTGNHVTFASTVDGAFAVQVNGAGVFGGAVGGTTALTTVGVTGATEIDGGLVNTSDDQEYDGAVKLGANTGLTSGGVITMGSTLDSLTSTARMLTISSNGVSVGGAIGGTHVLSTIGATTTGGNQTYSGAITLGGDGTFTGNTVTFGSTVDGAFALQVNGAGVFGDEVGGGTALTTVGVTGAAAINGGLVDTSGAQSYGGAVTLGADTGLTAGGLVTMGSTLDSATSTARTLTINSTGVSVGGAIGGSHVLSTIGVTTTGGNQTYSGAITLGGDGTFTGNTVTFGSSINGAFAVQVNGAGVFGGAVGGGTALTTVVVTGATEIDGGLVKTSGVQEYDGAVTVGANAGLTAGGVITFGSMLDSLTSTKRTLTISATGVTVGGAIGSVHPLSTLTVGTGSGNQTYSGAITLGGDGLFTGNVVTFESTVDGAFNLSVTGNAVLEDEVGGVTTVASVGVTGATEIDGGLVNTSSGQSYGGAVTLGVNTGLTAGGLITMGSTLDSLTSTPRTLTISATGVTVGGEIGGTNLLSTIDATTTGGNQTYSGAITLGGDGTFTGNTVTFGSTVDGAFALQVNGAGVFGDEVGGGTALTTVGVTGATEIDGGLVNTSSGQSYGGAVTLGANTGLTAGGLITLSSTLDSLTSTARTLTISATGVTVHGAIGATNPLSTLTVGTGSGNQTYSGAITLGGDGLFTGNVVTFGSTVDGAFNLSVTGNGVLGGAVGGTTTLASVGVTGATEIDGGLVKTSSGQSYGGAVTLGANTGLTAGGLITMGSTLDSLTSTKRTLTVSASGVTVAGAIGGTNPLSTLSVTTTGGNQTYSGAITLGADSTFTGSTITFGDTIDSGVGGPFGLIATGATTFLDEVGGISELKSVQVVGASDLNGGLVHTSLAQSYSGNSILSDNTQLTADGGVVSFGANIDSDGSTPRTLTVSGSGMTVTGAIGSTHVLGTIGVTTAGGNQLYSGAITLGGNGTFTGTSVNFGSTIDGAFAVQVNGAGVFGGAVGGTTGLTTLGVTGTTEIDGGLVHTTGGQSYGGAVAIGANAGLTAGGLVSMGSTLNSLTSTPVTLSITATGVTVGGAIGGTNPLGAMTVNTNTGNQTYSGAITLGGDTTLTGNTIKFGSTVDGGFGLMLVDSGLVTFADQVGSTTPLASLVSTGAVELDGSANAITTKLTGGITIGGALTLNANGATPVTTLSGGSVSLMAVDSAGATAQSLTIRETGSAVLGGAIGGLHQLNVLLVDGGTPSTIGGAVTIGGGSILTAGSQTFEAPVVLSANAALTGSTMTFASTVDGASTLTVNGAGVFDGVVGGTTKLAGVSVTGTTSMAGGAIHTTAGQTYGGAVTLVNGTTIDSVSGDVTFDGTVDGAVTLDVTGTNVKFVGSVGGTTMLTGLSSHGATEIGSSGTTTLVHVGNAAVDRTDYDVMFDGSLTVSGDVTVQVEQRAGAMSASVSAGGVYFGGTVHGATESSDSLTVKVPSWKVGGNAANENMPLIVFNDANVSSLGSLTLGFTDVIEGSGAGGKLTSADVPQIATIWAKNGLDLNVTNAFAMDRLEKLTDSSDHGIHITVTGSGGTAKVGDLTSAGDILVRASTISILTRPAARVRRIGAPDAKDLGVDLVSGKTVKLIGTLKADNEEGGTNNRVSISYFTTAPGLVKSSISGARVVVEHLRGAVTSEELVDDGTPLDLPDTGNFTGNPALAIAGATHITVIQPSQDPSISAAQFEVLQRMGINARSWTEEELFGGLNGSVMFLQDVSLPNQDGHRDVAVGRLSTAVVSDVVQSFTKQFGKVGPDGKVVLDEKIKASLTAAQQAYSDANPGPVNGAAFRTYLERADATPDEKQALVYLNSLQSFFKDVEKLGLTQLELKDVKQMLVSQVKPPGMSVTAFYEALFGPAKS